MKMNRIFCFLLLFVSLGLDAKYRIELSYDTFEGECVGFLSGTVGEVNGFTPGEQKNSLNGILSTKESATDFGNQKNYFINSDKGFYTFWIRDQFGDQDFGKDYSLITKVKPKIRIFQDNSLLKSIEILPDDGMGLTCKVFQLYAETGDIIVEKRFFEKTRIIIGKVVNAIDGNPMKDVLISNSKLNETISTDQYGIFVFDVPFGEFGKHHLNISKKGFITGEVSVNFGIDENPREVVYALSPKVDKYRIVLTWGSRPYDLDAHLSGPKPNGDNFHIWYRNRVLIDGKDFLDRDDTRSYGPETITIYKPAKGEYNYSVHNYSNRSSRQGRFLARSNAKVFVYSESRLVKSFDVPTDGMGNTWNVFKIDKQQKIIPINIIKDVRNESNIQ